MSHETTVPAQASHLVELIRDYASQVALFENYELPTELVEAIAAIAPYVPPKCPHNGEYTAQFQHGFNTCRKKVMSRSALQHDSGEL